MIGMYLLLMIIVFLGLVIGIILAKIAPEELKDGVPWFIRLQDMLFLLIILLLLYYNLSRIVIIPLIVFLIFYWYKETLGKNAYILEYSILGILVGTSHAYELFLPAATMAFLYLLASGSLLRYKSKRILKKVIVRGICFLLGTLLPLLIAYL